jgi:16S rRNA (guanine527-N7)-methyltransferase
VATSSDGRFCRCVLNNETGSGDRLQQLLAEAGMEPLAAGLPEQFSTYLALLLRWNARTNLTAVRDQEGILRRHFFESIACARLLAWGIATLLDLGSGAGFPGIPIAMCRPEIAVTLAESQNKKAAFLHEAVRQLRLSVSVRGFRAEHLAESFDCVVMRGVDDMARSVSLATSLVADAGFLAVMTTDSEKTSIEHSAGHCFDASATHLLPGSSNRILLLLKRRRRPG